MMTALSNKISTGGAFPKPSLRLLHLPRTHLPRPLPSTLRLCCRPLMDALVPSGSLQIAKAAPSPTLLSDAPDEARKGAEILVEALEREGVNHVFVNSGTVYMEMFEALTRSPTIVNHLLTMEVPATVSFAFFTRLPGVCITNTDADHFYIRCGLTRAQYNRVPLVAVIGEGTKTFQETPIVEMTRPLTKKNYLVPDVEDIPRVVREAFFVATTGRPGPVVIHIPKRIEQQLSVPSWDPPVRHYSDAFCLPKPPEPGHFNLVLEEGLFEGKFDFFDDTIPRQYAIQVLDELTDRRAIIDRQYQMWAPSFHPYKKPRNFYRPQMFGSKGCGLPVAAGAAVGRPGEIAVDVCSDESFETNMQDIAMIRRENLPVKVMILNTMRKDKSGISSDFFSIVEEYNIPAEKITKVGEVRTAIKKMLDTPGPYLLDVVVHHP